MSGESGLHSYAPPSHGQVLQMCHHLEALIRELQTQAQEMRRDLGHSDNGLASLKASIGNTNGAVQGLQEAQNTANVTIDNLKKELARTGSRVNKLGAGQEALNEQTCALREAQKVADTHSLMTRQDLDSLTERVNSIQVQLEKEQAKDNTWLKEQLRAVMSAVQDLREDHDRTKGLMHEHSQAIRAGHTNHQRLGDELAKTNTHTHTLEQRIAESASSLKAAKQGLSETNAVALKIHEDHKNTKASLAATQEGFKKLGAHVKQVNDVLESTKQQVHDNEENLLRTSAGMEQARDGLERTKAQVTSLDHAHQMLTLNAQNLREHLEDTHQSLQGVKATLKETNSIVLPNLRMEHGRPWSHGHSLESPGSRKSAGKKGLPATPRAFESGELSGRLDSF